MRTKSTAIVPMACFCIFASVLVVRGVGAGAPANDQKVSVNVPSRFSEAQREYIHSWVRELIPDCPREHASAAAEKFLQELQRQSPADLDRLMEARFPVRSYHSMLLRVIGAQLTGDTYIELREKVAHRRVQAILENEAGGKVTSGFETAELVTKIKNMAPVYPRRLFEGRMEDDELVLLIKKARESGTESVAALPAKPKVLAASDIVSEFSRRNQEGSAWQRLRALSIQGRLSTAGGQELEVLLFKMSPDRFRMVMMIGGTTQGITAFDGAKYWQQMRNQLPQPIDSKSIGSARYLGEFIDPLIAGEGISYERLPDGMADGQPVFRLKVRRSDGSSYVAWIDAETFRQVGRETEDKTVIRYLDFRVIAGITMAFREESTDAAGKKNVLVVTRMTPNPGLIQDFFEPPSSSRPGYFELEGMIARPPLAVAK